MEGVMEDLLFAPPALGAVLSLTGLPGGGNKIQDRSAYGNSGTITGASWVKLPSGFWVLSFDGVDDYVSCGNEPSLNIAAQVTMAAWTKAEYYASGTSMKLLLSKHSDYSGGLTLAYTGGTVYPHFRLMINGNPYYAQNTADHKDAWHCFVGTYDGKTIRLYADGREIGSTVVSGTIDSNSEPVRMGGGVAGRYVKGLISLARIYHRALSAFEIQNLFSCEKNLFGVW